MITYTVEIQKKSDSSPWELLFTNIDEPRCSLPENDDYSNCKFRLTAENIAGKSESLISDCTPLKQLQGILLNLFFYCN